MGVRRAEMELCYSLLGYIWAVNPKVQFDSH
jgi:hypothetical protein